MFTPLSRPTPIRLAATLVLVTMALSIMMPAQAQARYAAIVVDAASGRILHGRHIDTERYPASMTKMMTLYMVFEALDTGRLSMETPLHVSSRAAGQPPSKLGLRAGSTIRVKDAIRALVTKSANDVATVVAEALGQTESGFARLMTRKARALGMHKTTFRNASGLPNSGQKSTARDMAILAMSLMRHFPHHYHFFSLTSFRYNGHTYGSHNHLMKRYAGADGLKTGYIRASGFNVAFSASRHGRRVVAVVFGGRTARSRDDHVQELMDKGFRVVSQAAYHPFSGNNRIQVVHRPDLPSAVIPRPPALPPTKARAPQVASASPGATAGAGAAAGATAAATAGIGVGTVIPRVITNLLEMSKPDVDAPPADQQRTGSDSTMAPQGSWGVQVGAFSALAPAERAAHAAARLLSEQVDGVRVHVIPHTVADGKLYRARLVGMTSESQARAACRDLRAHQRSCLVVVPTGWTVAQR